MINNYIYDNLEYIRKKKKLTSRALALKLDIAPSTLTRWYNGRNGITLETAMNISEKLNIPLAQLIGTDLSAKNNNNETQISGDQAREEIKNIIDNSDMNDVQKKMIMTIVNGVTGDEEDEK